MSRQSELNPLPFHAHPIGCARGSTPVPDAFHSGPPNICQLYAYACGSVFVIGGLLRVEYVNLCIL